MEKLGDVMNKKPPMGKMLSVEQALSRLRQLCSRAEKCASDAQKKLHDWKIPANEIPAIIKKLQVQGFIDEARYAKAFVRDKSGLSHWGTVKIKQALQTKKIPAALITEALQEIDREKYENDLVQLLQRKEAALKAASPAECAARLLRFALSRGYEYDAAQDAVRRLAG
ncbi:MAG: RecX family transcriptional regulator [Prevotellaceae bacterium]|jgi:regulatory protein|nr:RecX family transcriptional regulator [Prevotellaceae bacterium]